MQWSGKRSMRRRSQATADMSRWTGSAGGWARTLACLEALPRKRASVAQVQTASSSTTKGSWAYRAMHLRRRGLRRALPAGGR